jgi:transposase
MFVDYAGATIPIHNPESGDVQQAAVFVAVLGASSYTFAEATSSQDLRNWIGSHIRALEFFGGVVEVVVPDNLKSAVTYPSYYEPDLNPTYRELAEHYGMAIIPARPFRARDKTCISYCTLSRSEKDETRRLRTAAAIAFCNRSIFERFIQAALVRAVRIFA